MTKRVTIDPKDGLKPGDVITWPNGEVWHTQEIDESTVRIKETGAYPFVSDLRGDILRANATVTREVDAGDEAVALLREIGKQDASVTYARIKAFLASIDEEADRG